MNDLLNFGLLVLGLVGVAGILRRIVFAEHVVLVMDIIGYCRRCKHKGQARLVAYSDKTILIRCNNCRTANEFDPDDATYNDPKRFAPFRDDEDPGDTSTGSGRHSGRRL